ncbi:glycerophosphodiester phosphodiesterase family protein [Carnobacterium gallinarum]|uniref:glycerophosphodiester phosphodiesterase family protein n=1 Tax=Carnobacterium gallinarum TaxID=2749 RepID=UPI000553B672|nr:glycerophosphodiester phosphodiesterase family protein [Carnobacterium gallinarum]
MIGKKEYSAVNHLLNQQLAEKKVLIAVHRGSAAGNILENTIPSYLAALQMGGDIIEMDVIRSTDGTLFNFHNGMEQKHFKEAFDIREKSAAEILDLRFVNSNLETVDYPVETFEATLKAFKGETLFNIDRTWGFYEDVCDLIDQYDFANQAILKGPLDQECIEFFKNRPVNYMFMPKIETLEELAIIQQIEGMNIVGVELKVTSTESDFYQKENIQKIHEMGLFVWGNAITYNDTKKLFVAIGDNLSIIDTPEKGWGFMMDLGINVLQTDWPAILSNYRQQWVTEQNDEVGP